jgi:hypothetical protein
MSDYYIEVIEKIDLIFQEKSKSEKLKEEFQDIQNNYLAPPI